MKGLLRSLSRAPKPRQKTVRIDLSFNAAAMVIDGAIGVGFGTLVSEALPEGNLQILGAVASLQFAGPGASANLSDTWAGDFGIGTTPADDATITGADVNIIPSTALAAATAEVSPVTRAVLAAPVVIDNTEGTAEININVLVDDIDISANALAFTVTGSLSILYTVLGDD